MRPFNIMFDHVDHSLNETSLHLTLCAHGLYGRLMPTSQLRLTNVRVCETGDQRYEMTSFTYHLVRSA